MSSSDSDTGRQPRQAGDQAHADAAARGGETCDWRTAGIGGGKLSTPLRHPCYNDCWHYFHEFRSFAISDNPFATQASAPQPGRARLPRKGLKSAMPDVLVIDDSPTVRMTIRKWLEGAGYEVEEASDGMEGLNKLRASKE